MTVEKDSPNREFEGTRIDLGEDLLKKSEEVRSRPLDESRDALGLFPLQTVEPTSDSPEDVLESARILINEGLLEDAKKLLHRILIHDPENIPARQSLDQVHELELKQIFGEGDARKTYGRRFDFNLSDFEADVVMRKLDEDLGLGLFSGEIPEAQANQLSLFQDAEMMNDFVGKLEAQLETGSFHDWIDLGIAFLQVDLYSVSIRLFSGALQRIPYGSEGADESNVSATSLLALSYILSERPFEAISKIQPVLRDVEIAPEKKVELLYLIGRTYESLRKFDLAFGYYQQVKEIDPYYRDVERRLSVKQK